MGFIVAGLEAPTCLLFCKNDKTEGACGRLMNFVALFTGISRSIFYTLGCIPMFLCEIHASIVLTVLFLLCSAFFYFMEWLAPSEPAKDGDVINEDLLTDSERAEAGVAGIPIDEGGNSWDRFVGGAVDAAAKAAAPAIAAAAVNQMTGQLPNPFGTSSSGSGNIGDGGGGKSSSSPARSTKAASAAPGNPFAKTAAAEDPTGNPFANPFTGNIPPSPSAPRESDSEGNPFMAK